MSADRGKSEVADTMNAIGKCATNCDRIKGTKMKGRTPWIRGMGGFAVKTIRIIFAAVFLLSPTSAFSARGFVTGDELSSKCSINSPMCMGYIAGVSDIMSTDGDICLPNNATIQQIVDIVAKYLSDHPERRHYSASSESGIALMQAFPCSK
jgi:Rap1a immunity proteins